MLATFVPDYDKQITFAMCSAGYPQAVSRAMQMDQVSENIGDPGCNPTTGVYRLAELIRGE